MPPIGQVADVFKTVDNSLAAFFKQSDTLTNSVGPATHMDFAGQILPSWPNTYTATPSSNGLNSIFDSTGDFNSNWWQSTSTTTPTFNTGNVSTTAVIDDAAEVATKKSGWFGRLADAALTVFGFGGFGKMGRALKKTKLDNRASGKKGAANFVKTLGKNVWQSIKTGVSNLRTKAKSLWTAVKTTAWPAVKSWIRRKLAKSIALKMFVTALGGFLTTLPTGVTQIVGPALIALAWAPDVISLAKGAKNLAKAV